MAMLRGEQTDSSVLIDVLDQVTQRAEVYVLLWSGAPVALGPTTKTARNIARLFAQRAPRVHFRLDPRASFSHDHHQKAVTVDGRVAYVGGMDLTTYQGDRWDTHDHPLRFGPNWHDVMARLEGEVVQDVEENFCQRWNAVTGDHLEPIVPPPAEPTGHTPAQIIRTVPAGFYPFAPSGKHGIFHAMTTAIRTAQRYIYLENQYIWAPEIVDALCDAIRNHKGDDFCITMVLPARADEGRYDNDRHVEALNSEDDGRKIFRAYSLYTGGPATGPTGFVYRPIYVHAKVSIVDDEWFSIGSANLNRRGIATDTEMNVQGIDPKVARALRLELWSKHLGTSQEEIAAREPTDLLRTAWPQAAHVMEHAIQHSTPPPPGRLRVYIPGRAPSNRILDYVQSLTLEH